MKEKCAVFGFQSDTDVFETIYYGLHAMQHRGQESAGIATCNDKIRIHKGMGLVSEVFRNAYLSGNCGIGHVRYSTTGDSKSENAQPLLINYLKGVFAIAHNGNIVNQEGLKKMIEEMGGTFTTTTDTELIAHLIAQEHLKTGDFIKAVQATMKQLVGSYSLAILYDGMVIGVRDPSGVRPLCIGRKGEHHYLASESCALDTVGAELLRDVKPGEIVVFGDQMKSYSGPKGRLCHCMFEYVYFARADSVIDGRPIYKVRRDLGRILARESPVEADIVCAVPDSGITHAIGYANGSGIPYSEAFMKNRYVGRTFILPDQKQRELGVRVKMNPIRSEVEGKRIVLLDDSIVRGTTLKKIIESLRKSGAKEVHVRIASPPIRNPCLYGIDMQTSGEFIASEKSVEEIGKTIGADTLAYLSVDGLVEAIGHSRGDLCLACLTGEYPLENPQRKLVDE
ncbi:MAG: amidophosphoribosyltransferase [Candidatus Altiarchaeales archaeon]|nr:amidophosphoribosyltransferase [Candidatus Altiarchaeales archaeon]MBD3416542.1 amidophosphoribosyltransferase [Candidatus Altiarchaeales archaeon]